jgi:hypothetical protein
VQRLAPSSLAGTPHPLPGDGVRGQPGEGVVHGFCSRKKIIKKQNKTKNIGKFEIILKNCPEILYNL